MRNRPRTSPFSGDAPADPNQKRFRYGVVAANRFADFFEIDSEDRLIQARFNEYVCSRVSAPFFMKVLVHTKREYTASRL